MRKPLFLWTTIFFAQVCCAFGSAATLRLAPDTTWIPTPRNIASVTVNLTGAAGNSHVTFQLISTNWPGYCMNAFDSGTEENPITRPDKNPDLQFLPDSL